MNPVSFSVLVSLAMSPCLVFGAQPPSSPEGPTATAGALSRQSAEKPPKGDAANRWRYSFHNGHWWYYRDGGRWSYWTGTSWHDYEPKPYGRWYLKQKMADYDAEVARFDATTMAPYMSPLSGASSSGWGTLDGDEMLLPFATTRTWMGSSRIGLGSSLFVPRGFDGRLNYATSVGGYMGGALRGPFDY